MRISPALTWWIPVLVSACGPSELGTPNGDSRVENVREDAEALASSAHSSMLLFEGGGNGYHSFRIPSLVKTNSGVLLAIAEGRRNDNEDHGDINVVIRRSTDDGATWSSLKDIAGKGAGTWGNPTAVVDKQTDRVWLFMSWNDAEHNHQGTDGYLPIDSWGQRRVYSSYSDDDGVTWSAPVNMTSTLLPSNYAWDAMGPGTGVQTAYGESVGRLVIPAIGRNIYSDDHGSTWAYATLPGGTSEGTVVELLDGQLLRNDRAVPSLWNAAKRRYLSTGTIEAGFEEFQPHDDLLDPRCEGSMLRYTSSPSRILFLNPASTESRCRMRVRISYDEGITWPVSRRINDTMSIDQECDSGKGGYSSIAKTADLRVGALIEVRGTHYSIEFHKFGLAWILNGQSEP